MKKVNKILLAVITLCSVGIKMQALNTDNPTQNIDHVLVHKKPKTLAKPGYLKKANIEKKDVKKFGMHTSKISTLLALQDLFASENIRPNNTNRWIIQFRATPPFWDVEPMQQKISV